MSEQDCAGYDCVAENTTAGCQAGQYFANQNVCVNIQDCMCVDYNGNLVKVWLTAQLEETCNYVSNFSLEK